MKKIGISIGLLFTALAVASAQVTVSGDFTTIGVISFAEDSQLITNTPGGYTATKNGFYTNAGLVFSFSPESYIEGYSKILAIYRPGSFYVPLSLESTGEKSLALELDSAYGKFHLFDALSLSIPVDVSFKTGKYKAEAASFQKVSKYGTESVTSMLKTGNTYNYDLEVAYPIGEGDISASFTSNYRFDEAVQRRYDNDGSVSNHGETVLDEYQAQIFATLKLKDFEIAGSPLSAEFVYALNGADFYTGNSLGFSAGYKLALIDGTLALPIGVGFAYYEKNLDALAGVAGNNSTQNTTSFRGTTHVGLGVGVRYTADPVAVDFNLAGAYSLINHIYRDPLNLISASADAQFTFDGKYFLGAGLFAGTFADAEWKTKDGETHESYKHTFTFAENMGYEVYAGIGIAQGSKFLVGYNNNKGIAINRTLETRPDSQIKYKQKDTAIADDLFETGGVYVKFVFAW
jgi:hypothetical protein